VNITGLEILFLFVVVAVPSAISYLLGRRFSPPWLGFMLSLIWLPILLVMCPPAYRVGILAAILWSFIPIIVAFVIGVMQRPLKPNQ